MWIVLSPAFAVAPPAPTTPRGFYEAPFSLDLAPGDAGDTFTYSLDGSLPTRAWTGPLDVAGTTVFRAQAHGADGSVSDVVTHTYLFVADVPLQAGMDPAVVGDPTAAAAIDSALRTLPSVSIVLPGAVSLSEQAVSVEWLDPAGDTTQVACGAEIIGGTSYVYPKTSLRLHFRSAYGAPRWEADLYGDDATGVAPATSFDALTLRSGNHDSVFYLGAAGQYTRNYWMDETSLEMGHLDAHGRYVNVYYDGEYRGLYHLRERFDAGFLAGYLGGEEEDYEAINGGSAFDGTGAAWNQVVSHAGEFAAVRDWLDVENFLDYMVQNFYAANAWDWSPDHNWIAAGPTRPGEGGFIFHNADSDICLYYDPTTNILSNGGPSNVFGALLREGDPDFRVALADALHRNLEDGGPLTAARAGARYQRLADLADAGIFAESARWGGGWWTHDEEWVTERDWLLDTFFPARTDLLLDQVRAAGWYPLDAPDVDTPSGVVTPGSSVLVTVPDGTEAELWVTGDGEDPRLPGGLVYGGATGPDAAQTVRLAHGTILRARLKRGGTWGPLAERIYEADEPPPLLVNEWNTTDPDTILAGGDAALGSLPGDGGDWIELLVMEDHLDVRGWRLVLEDRHHVPTELVLGDAPLLGDLRAGTLFTIAEDLPEDPAYDPDRGDWRFHLRAGADGGGGYVSAVPFDVTARDWQVRIFDAAGALRVGQVGEAANPGSGIGGDEVGLLAETPTAATRRWSAAYTDGRASTFGAPNVWEGGAQDLSALRGEHGDVVEIDDTATPSDTAGRGAREEEGADTCGCVTPMGRSPGWSVGAALVAAAWTARRRRIA